MMAFSWASQLSSRTAASSSKASLTAMRTSTSRTRNDQVERLVAAEEHPAGEAGDGHPGDRADVRAEAGNAEPAVDGTRGDDLRRRGRLHPADAVVRRLDAQVERAVGVEVAVV